MEHLSDRTDDWQKAENDNDPEASPQLNERIAEILTRAKAHAETALGTSIDPEIADLSSGTLGDCDSQSGKIRLAADFIPEKPEDITTPRTRVMLPDEDELTHVMIHEGTHRMRFAASNDNLPEETEEGLTELATAEHTGEIIAYHDFVDETRAKIQRVGLPIKTMTNAYRNGNIGQIRAVNSADAMGMTFAEYQKLVTAKDNDSYALAA